MVCQNYISVLRDAGVINIESKVENQVLIIALSLRWPSSLAPLCNPLVNPSVFKLNGSFVESTWGLLQRNIGKTDVVFVCPSYLFLLVFILHVCSAV